jgi:hypothetical protein
LPADFEVALQGVDTRLKALQPGTTLGDLAYSSATANTNTRLPIGTTGQVLAVSGGVPAWATPATSGLTFITGTSFSAVSSVSLPTDTFSTTYLNYKIIFNLTAAGGAITETRFRLRAAGADNTSALYSNGGYEINSAGGGAASSGQTQTSVLWGNIATSTPEFTKFEMTLFSPKATAYTTFNVNGSKGTATWKAMTGFYEATTSFDAMTFYPDAGTITGSYRVYGIANS